MPAKVIQKLKAESLKQVWEYGTMGVIQSTINHPPFTIRQPPTALPAVASAKAGQPSTNHLWNLSLSASQINCAGSNSDSFIQ
jgi:hypothetical protein